MRDELGGRGRWAAQARSEPVLVEAERVGLRTDDGAALDSPHARSDQVQETVFDRRPPPVDYRPGLTLDHQVYNTAYRITGNAALAADVCSHVLQQYARLPARRWEHRRKVWMMHALFGACRKLQRSQPFRTPLYVGRRQSWGVASPLTGSGTPAGDATVPRQDPLTLVQAGLDKLPFELRATVVLSDVAGLSYQQIAGATGVSVKTVRSRLSRGRIELRDTLFGTPPSE